MRVRLTSRYRVTKKPKNQKKQPASDFLKVLLKFKMAAMDKLHIFFVGAKTKKLKSVIIHIVQSHYPPSGNLHVILLKFKMATTIDFLNICDRKKPNLIYGGG